MIEVELRSFISEEKYNSIVRLFESKCNNYKYSRQITYYFENDVDTRLQISSDGGKLWQKLGRMHAIAREELEALFSRTDAEVLLKIFINMGMQIKVIWFRERKLFDIDGVKLSLDYTVGYGYIIEAEICSSEDEVKNNVSVLEKLFNSLGVIPSSGKDFDREYELYLKSWKERTKQLGLSWVDIK